MATQTVHAGQTDVVLLRKSLPLPDSLKLQKAFDVAKQLYGDTRYDLMPTITLLEHVTGVLRVFAEFCPDEDAMVACLLQHALRQGGATMQQIEEQFGKSVRDIVSRVHLLSHLHRGDWRKSIDDKKIMLVSVADDMRILLLQLSIQCYLTEHLDCCVDSVVRAQIGRESLHVYAPLAARLGIYALKYRLEERAFPVSYPTDHEKVTDQLLALHTQYGDFLPVLVASLKDFLEKEGVTADVMGREKQSYSIFQKMQTKSMTDIRKITDLYAVRVVTHQLPDCYQLLGLLHRVGTPLSHRFKDYISFPKPNGYQSLHTCLLGLPGAPKDVMIEVQIRTLEMHREAEYGIAAHWVYKEVPKTANAVKRLYMNDVIMKQQSVDARSPRNAELTLADHIYVLTPRGDIIELPEGGTPLDFAFMLHTELGLKFKAARVNGTVVPISHELENGDVVEVLTHKHPRPSMQWLDQVVTSSARSKLKAYFFSSNRSEFVGRGREMLNAELKERRVPLLDNDLSLLKTFDGKPLTVKEREDVLVKIGMGSVRTSSLFKHLAQFEVFVPRKKGILDSTRKHAARSQNEVVIEGSPVDLPLRFAKCCGVHTAKPRPEEIVGFITRAGAVSIHREDCAMVRDANAQRRVKVRWA